MFITKRLLPTPRMTADDYYRYAIVPTVEQRQSGFLPGLGEIGSMGAHARLVKQAVNGMVDYVLLFKGGS